MGGRCFRLCRLNPPAHPEDERRRAGSGLPAWDILPKPSLSGVRVTRRGNHLLDVFFRCFFRLAFSSQKCCFSVSPGTKKSTQNRLLGQKLAPQVDFLIIFRTFLPFLCSGSPSGSIFGGCDPSELCSRHSGSSILTKSPFSEKRRKPMRRGTLLVPKIA